MVDSSTAERGMPATGARLRRRSLLAAGGALALGGASAVPARAARAQGGGSDAPAAAFAAGIELAAVAAYQAALGRGLLDDVAFGLATTFAGHHLDHAATFNGLLAGAGEQPVTAPDQAVLERFGPLVGGAADPAGLLQVAHDIELGIASTYVDALRTLAAPDTALAVSRILAVEAQHAVVLASALGLPVGERLPAFETTTDRLPGG